MFARAFPLIKLKREKKIAAQNRTLSAKNSIKFLSFIHNFFLLCAALFSFFLSFIHHFISINFSIICGWFGVASLLQVNAHARTEAGEGQGEQNSGRQIIFINAYVCETEIKLPFAVCVCVCVICNETSSKTRKYTINMQRIVWLIDSPFFLSFFICSFSYRVYELTKRVNNKQQKKRTFYNRMFKHSNSSSSLFHRWSVQCVCVCVSVFCLSKRKLHMYTYMSTVLTRAQRRFRPYTNTSICIRIKQIHLKRNQQTSIYDSCQLNSAERTNEPK